MGFSPQFKRVQCSAHVLATFSRLTHLHRCGPYNNIRDRFVYSYIGLPLFFLHNVSPCDFHIQLSCDSLAQLERDVTGCINNRQPVVTENCDIAKKCVNKDDNVNSASMYINKQLCFDHTLGFFTQPSSIFIVSYSSPLDKQHSVFGI